MFSVIQSFSSLSENEQRRIQKQWKVILRQNNDQRKLKNSLLRSLIGLGSPRELILNPDSDAFLKLMSHFGAMKSSDLNRDEQNFLQEHPYVVKSPDDCFHIPEEVYEVLIKDVQLRKEDFLIHYIYYLPLAEKKSWFRWLAMDWSAGNQREFSLYSKISEMRGSTDLNPSTIIPVGSTPFLDDLFKGEADINPVNWFFRGVLPFYRTLSDYENLLSKNNYPGKENSQIKKWIQMFKLGYISIRPDSVEYGEKQRWKVFVTRELPGKQESDLQQGSSLPQTTQSSQGLLFS